MYTIEEFKVAIIKCLNEREREIIKAKFGYETELLLPRLIFDKYNTNIEEIRSIEKKISDFIRGNRT